MSEKETPRPELTPEQLEEMDKLLSSAYPHSSAMLRRIAGVDEPNPNTEVRRIIGQKAAESIARSLEESSKQRAEEEAQRIADQEAQQTQMVLDVLNDTKD